MLRFQAEDDVLRLTRIADYGVLLMASMAGSDKPRLTASELAARTRIPAPTVSKILQALLAGRLLTSARGAHGGYALALPAAEISVADILRCLDGELALTECAQHDSRCDQQAVCTISRNWQGINRSIARALRGISLADMMAEGFAPEFCLITERRRLPLRLHASTACQECSGSMA